MGGWHLEIAKMALYVTFPVCMFHYFNQPEYFEEWVVKTKREIFPPDNPEKKKMFEDSLRKIKANQEKRMVAELDEKS